MPRYAVLLIVSGLTLACCRQRDDKPMTGTHPSQALTDENVQDANSFLDKETNVSMKNQIVNRMHYHTIEIKQMKFDPPELIVQKGDTVAWINNDMVVHDVTEQYAKEWTSSPIPLKESWQMVITKSSDYYCSLHVVMRGKIIAE